MNLKLSREICCFHRSSTPAASRLSLRSSACEAGSPPAVCNSARNQDRPCPSPCVDKGIVREHLFMEAIMFKIRHIDHVVLRAGNIETMMAFYIDVLGCSLEKIQEQIGLNQLRAGASLIDLVRGNSQFEGR